MSDPREEQKDLSPLAKGCLGIAAFFFAVCVAFVFFVVAVCGRH